MGKKLNNFRKWTYNRLVWILLLLSAILLLLSKLDIFIDEANALIEKLSFAVASSGVFAAVLKSLQFQGIFKEEIEAIILSDKFIEERNDKEKLWRSVSRAIYKKKYPKISKELNNIIFDEYFPKKRKYYYDDYRVTITIKELTEEGVIKFDQTISYKVIMQTGEKVANIVGAYTIDKLDDNSTVENINDRKYFKVDDIDIMSELNINSSENEFETTTEYSTVVKDKPEFTIEMKDYREYNIFEDNVKIFRTSAITKEMNVSITYPDNMHVQFFNIGVIQEFQKVHIGHKNCISRTHKNGLILPNQGFGMSFGFKKKC